MKEKRNIITVSTLAVITLVLILAGTTYAYLVRYWKDTDIDVPTQVSTNTTDSLMLNVDADISILATPDNYDIGMESVTETSKATALLQANNKTKKVSANYYIYLDILENEFIYTSEDNSPELLLHVVDPNGNIMTDINGLEYVTVTDGKGDSISGFDITTWKDTITIASFYEIATDTKKTDDWQISVTFVNLATPQKENTGRSFNAKLLLQKNPLSLGDICANIDFGRCIQENYTSDRSLIFHNEALEKGTHDNSVRYSGSYESVNNYVCFGYDGNDACPNANLFRIIGVFDNQIKLIKSDYALITELGSNYNYKSAYGTTGGVNKGLNTNTDIGLYYWTSSSSSATNTWYSAGLGNNNLNRNYLGTFSQAWQEKIAVTNWKVGGGTNNNYYYSGPYGIYLSEIVNMATDQRAVTNKIGLMYASDYGYAADMSAWPTALYNYNTNDIPNKNWMYNGLHEWTMSRTSDTSYVIYVDYRAYIRTTGANSNAAVRPVFYLNTDVKMASGNGTYDSPYKILNVIETEETA